MSTKIRHLETKIAYLDKEVELYCNSIDSLSKRLEQTLTHLRQFDPKYVEKIMRELSGQPEPEPEPEQAAKETVAEVVTEENPPLDPDELKD